MPRRSYLLPVLLLILATGAAFAQKAALYNGREYVSGHHGAVGHPFLLTDTFLTATVFYDGYLFTGVRAQYDMAGQQLVVQEPEHGYLIALNNAKIHSFTIGAYKFEQIPFNGSASFFEVSQVRGVPLYTLHSKRLRAGFKAEDPMVFVEDRHYFVAAKGKLKKIASPARVKAYMRSDTLAIVSRPPARGDTISPFMKNILAEKKIYQVGNAGDGSNKSTFSISGYVRDATTGEAVHGALGEIDSLQLRAFTDQYGYYSILLPKGRHRLSVSGSGPGSITRYVDISGDGVFDVDVRQRVGSLKTVVVVAENNKLKSGRMSPEKFTIKAIKQVPAILGEADVLRIVTTLPGVSTTGEASTGFNVRGGSADQNLILFNEATIYNPSHLFGFFSAFSPDVVKSVELYKASVPERYGGRLSSVLSVLGREGNSNRITGSGGVGPVTGKLTIEGPLWRPADSLRSPATFILSGRTTYSNWLLRALPNERYRNSRASFQDLNLNIAHNLNKKNSIYITAYASNDNFRLNNDTTYGYGNVNANIRWKHLFSSSFNMVAAAGRDHYHYQIHSNEIPENSFRLRFRVNQSFLRSDFNWIPHKSHQVNFGIHSIHYRLDPGEYSAFADGSLVKAERLQREQALETSLFAGDEFTMSPKFSITAGIRYSIFNYLGPYNADYYASGVPKDTGSIQRQVAHGTGKIIKTWQAPEFRVSAKYAVSERSSVKIAVNSTRQYIHLLSNTTIISPTDIWKLSDHNIRPQSGIQFSAGYFRDVAQRRLELSAELYYRKMKNVLDYKSGARLLMNEHLAADLISAEGKAFGAEFMVKKSTGKINGWVSYTLSRTFLRQNDSLAGETINGGAYYPSNFDRPHNLNIIGNYRFTHRLSVSLTVTYTSGRPVTIPVALFDFGGSQRVYYSDRNQYRIPDYFRADASFTLEGNHRLKQKIHNSWSFGLYNLTGRQNPYSVYFRQESGVIRGYQLSIFGTVIPFVTYNFRF